jgi:hypothetical protein
MPELSIALDIVSASSSDSTSPSTSFASSVISRSFPLSSPRFFLASSIAGRVLFLVSLIEAFAPSISS